MPTELRLALARKHSAQTQSQANVTILLVCLILCLVNCALALLDPAVARAVELLGQY